MVQKLSKPVPVATSETLWARWEMLGSAQSIVAISSSGHLQDSFAWSLLRRNAFRWPGGRRETISPGLGPAITNLSLHRRFEGLALYADFEAVRTFCG